jgi:hypothetical protein
MLPLNHSDDLNRYMWEGKIQLSGFSPYNIAPDDEVLVPLRDEIWQGINHKSVTAIYGPLSQLVFKATASVWYSPLGFKVFIMIFDVGTILFLYLLLKSRGARINELILYALNPLVLYSFAAEGHLEAMLLFFIAGAIYWHQRKSFGWMFFFFGLAASVKLTALMFAPLFISRDSRKFIPFILLPLLTVLPFIPGIENMLFVMKQYGTKFYFNGFAYGVISSFTGHQLTIPILIALFVVSYGWIFFFVPDVIRASGCVALIFLLTSPSAHPWYFTIVAMFAVLYPLKSWILLSGTVSVSWLVSFRYWTIGIWQEFAVQRVIEYIPPAIMEFLTRFRFADNVYPCYAASKSITIVLPVLNESDNIARCLNAIVLPKHVASEIIVVDCGSTDDTVQIAKKDKRVKMITSDKGRGIQIAKGVDNASGDLIIVVHADTLLHENCVEQILLYINSNLSVTGGAVASRFDQAGIRFRLITLLNNFRARFTGISFGDQVQFFRKEILKDIMPRVKLMEDVEISMLLKERGTVVLLPSLARSSTRRWMKKAYTSNMFMIVGLTAFYLTRRRFALLESDNDNFYRMYYGK